MSEDVTVNKKYTLWNYELSHIHLAKHKSGAPTFFYFLPKCSSPRSNGKLLPGQWSTSKQVTSRSSTPEPTIRSCDTGQMMPCFYSCQLATTWMSNIQDLSLHSNCMPRSTFIKSVWAQCWGDVICWADAPAIHATGHDLRKKMKVLVLLAWGYAWRPSAAGAPLSCHQNLQIERNDETSFLSSFYLQSHFSRHLILLQGIHFPWSILPFLKADQHFFNVSLHDET